MCNATIWEHSELISKQDGVDGKNGVSFHVAFTALLQLFGSWIHLCRTYHNTITNSRSREWSLIIDHWSAIKSTDRWIAYLIFLIFFIICIRRSAPIEDEDDEPTPEEEEEELREEPVIGDSERTCLIFQTQYLQGGRSIRLYTMFCWHKIESSVLL